MSLIKIIVKADRLVMVFGQPGHTALVELGPDEAVTLGVQLLNVGRALKQLREVPS